MQLAPSLPRLRGRVAPKAPGGGERQCLAPTPPGCARERAATLPFQGRDGASRYAPANSAATAATRSPNALVPSGPPRSAVRHSGRAITASSARSISSPARSRRVAAAALAEPGEQHAGRTDQRGRVGEVAARDVGRRAVLGLRQRMRLARIDRGGEAEAAGDLGGLVGQDVAEHVGGDDHVERARVAHQQRRHGVDDTLLVGDVGVVLRHRAHALEKQAVGHAQHVGLVHRRHLAAAAGGEAECRLGDAGGALAADLAHRQGEVGRRHELAEAVVHRAVGIEPLGVLAHDDEIHLLAATRRKARARAGRADVSEQRQALAQFPRRVEAALGHRGIFVVRDRAENDAVGVARGREGGVRQGRADAAQGFETDRDLAKGEAEPEACIERAQHGQRSRHDFRADPVAVQHGELHRAGLANIGRSLRHWGIPFVDTISPASMRRLRSQDDAIACFILRAVG